MKKRIRKTVSPALSEPSTDGLRSLTRHGAFSWGRGAALLWLAGSALVYGLEAPSDLYISESRSDGTRIAGYLKWKDNSATEKGFIVESSSDGKTYVDASRIDPNVGFAKVTLAFGAKQWYRVRSHAGLIRSEPTAAVELVGVAPPTRLESESRVPTEATLTWRNNAVNSKGIRVLRSDDGTTFKVVADLLPGTATYVDKSLPLGKTYFYRVVSFVDAGNSPAMDTVSIAPGSPPGPALAADARLTDESTNGKVPTSILFTWRDSSNVEMGYRVDRRINGGDWATVLALSSLSPSRSYLERGVTEGAAYEYRVCVTNLVGSSECLNRTVWVPRVAQDQATRKHWYVDNAATSSDHTGTSWGKAWRGLNSVNWIAVKPGDTIHMSGGTSSKTYVGGLTVSKDGAEGQPLTFVVGGDEGHNGRVIIDGGVSFGAHRWVTVTGAKAGETGGFPLAELSSRINLEVSSPWGHGVFATGCVGTKILYAEIHSAGRLNQDAEHGVKFHAYNDAPREAEIAYCHIHDNWNDGVNIPTNPLEAYGGFSVHHNVIELNGDDGVQAARGTDIFNNIIRKRQLGLGAGHPDGIQTNGGYLRVYNNIISDFPNAFMFMEISSPMSGEIQIYNNNFFAGESKPPYAISIGGNALYSAGNYIDVMEWRNVVIANNVFTDLPASALTFTRASGQVGVIRVRQSRVQNNIFHNCSYNFPNNGVPVSVKGYPGSGLDFTEADLIFENNIVSGPCKRIDYKGVKATAEELNLKTSFNNNSSVSPIFFNYSGKDFRLATTDTAALNKGADLTAVTSMMPALRRDIQGVLRPLAGGWDIGPFEGLSNGPVTPPNSTGGTSGGDVTVAPATPKNLRVLLER